MNASENTAAVNSPTFTPFFSKSRLCLLHAIKASNHSQNCDEGFWKWKTAPTLASTGFALAFFLLFSAKTTKSNTKVSSRGFWRDGCAFKNDRKTPQSVHVPLNLLVQKN